ncbi:hypothetical protein PF005_g19528 [Phytophthora fragariae]|uniref:Uncharacterized protein n=1 Tax=Phytophthora fragariae TaxID=53985 RepID=A0A6A3WVD7_9STRA|nr:hypothetical protein PF003_g20832 [Phytophthora fragariae]KAE8928790.1 hypothetical protein PF009_g21085 [Phytophthora fragariae]KAE9087878.1 hypothetical protein PF007_g20201 [Phytophthora fragariae]KAE9116274.1 hypothetical protein PF006_g19080 [Phytophthora fragariae]KAE9189727.1 hypothetical protein PF005_g19528 [Phytophthora fragariae]
MLLNFIVFVYLFDEPNICAPGEDVTEYAALDSDGESEDISVIDDDE